MVYGESMNDQAETIRRTWQEFLQKKTEELIHVTGLASPGVRDELAKYVSMAIRRATGREPLSTVISETGEIAVAMPVDLPRATVRIVVP